MIKYYIRKSSLKQQLFISIRKSLLRIVRFHLQQFDCFEAVPEITHDRYIMECDPHNGVQECKQIPLINSV